MKLFKLLRLFFRVGVIGCLTAGISNAGDKVALFNGKDLTGWTGDGYEVKDGAIYCTPNGKNLTSVKTYSNYVLEFEFKLPPAGNNGLGIHYTGEGDPAYTGMEVQILDDTSPTYKDLKVYQFHGGLYTLKAAKGANLKPLGEWNTKKITVNANHVIIELNGKVINEANLDDLAKEFPKHTGVKRREGFICFCGHGDPVAYRNINITDTTLPETDRTGFTKLYNEKDLAGWRDDKGHIGHWIPKGEVLHYDGKSEAKEKDLWTAKSYKNFTLVFDWRWADSSAKMLMRPVLDPATGETKKDQDGKDMTEEVIELDSGIYMRGNNKSQVNLWNWPCGSGEVYGYRMDKTLSQELRAALVPKVRADHPIGAWNRMEINLIGEKLNVVLNGKKVLENAKLPGVPAEGGIALQHHGSALEFKHIYIKEHH